MNKAQQIPSANCVVLSWSNTTLPVKYDTAQYLLPGMKLGNKKIKVGNH